MWISAKEDDCESGCNEGDDRREYDGADSDAEGSEDRQFGGL